MVRPRWSINGLGMLLLLFLLLLACLGVAQTQNQNRLHNFSHLLPTPSLDFQPVAQRPTAMRFGLNLDILALLSFEL